MERRVRGIIGRLGVEVKIERVKRVGRGKEGVGRNSSGEGRKCGRKEKGIRK